MIPWTYRDAEVEDLPYIFSTWLKSARRQGDRGFMTNTTYFQNEKRRIEAILEKSRTLVICNEADESHLLGWICFGQVADVFVIHYAYTKRDYQKNGIMKALISKLYPRLGKEQIAITHVSDLIAAKRDKYRLHYHPFLTQYLSPGKETVL